MVDGAGRLSRALFRHASALGEVEAVREDLALLARVVGADSDTMRLVRHPRIPLPEKLKVLCPLASTELVRRLVSTLVENQETDLLKEIHQRFKELAGSVSEAVEVEARVAYPLTADEETRLCAAASEALGRKVQVRVVVDPSLIAGVRLRAGNRVFERSLRFGLEELRARLLNG